MTATPNVSLDKDSQDQLDRRVENGEHILVTAWGQALRREERESAAKDAISNILTALYGPYGSYSPGGSFKANPGAWSAANILVTSALRAWNGDAEDYTRAPEPGEYGYEDPED